MENFGDRLGQVAMSISNNKFLATIRNTFIAIIPFTIVGAIAVLFGSVLFTENLLGGISGLEFLLELQPLFNAVNYASMNVMSLMVSYLIGYYLAREFKIADSVFAGLVSFASFVVIAPTYYTPDASEPETIIDSLLHVDITGSQGLFLAMITGLLATRLYIYLVGVDRLEIKLHESVPQNVARSFSALIPATIVLFTVGIFGYLFNLWTNMEFSDLIYSVVQVPLEAAMQTPFGIIAMAFMAQFLWFFGIHGSSIVNGITDPILLSTLASNSEAVISGMEPPYLITRPSWNIYSTIGGSGSTFPLIVAVLLFSKRDDERAIAKVSIAPGLFGINEPMIFGMPLVLNPTYAIPFILGPVVSVTIGYFATSLGIAHPPYINIPWSSPPFVNAFISTGGHIGTVLTQLVCAVVVFFIYLPFVRISNRQFKMQQTAEEGNE